MTRVWLKLSGLALCAMLASSCGPHATFAPVADVSGYETVPKSGQYRVKSGDTLYSIAWRFGIDYNVLARQNLIEPPYAIHAGEVIYLNGRRQAPAKTRTARNSKPAGLRTAVEKEPNYQVKLWKWPARGEVVSRFSRQNNGIKIRGYYGESVYAAAPGKVVYAGNGLRGYGNLIIIKHNNQYLSAYALNKSLFVREGQWVKRGQKIAQVGVDVANRPSLHFEIRRFGKPVNPLPLLKS